MFKNAFVYRLAPGAAAPTSTDLDARLAGASFVACGATERESIGWVPPRGDKHAALAESVGGQIILKLCSETRAVPGGAVKARLEERLDQIEQQTGRRPKGKGARDIKDEVVHELLPRAFPKRSTTPVWLDLASSWLLVGAASAKKADAVATALVEAFAGGLTLLPLQTALAPATAMAAWLAEREAPSGFSIDRDCELKQPDSEKAAVRYARHSLDLDEVGAHIRQGKLPTQLALTWGGRVSFVLTEALALKKIKLLDVVLEGQDSDKGRGDDGFDADVAIVTGELRQLLPDLVAALGGELADGVAPG
jgi:recombination associated protein RdgC